RPANGTTSAVASSRTWNFKRISNLPKRPWPTLSGGVAAIDQNRLPGHPPAIADQVADEGHHVLKVGQAGRTEGRERRRSLVVGHRVSLLGWIEERRVPRTRSDRGHRDAPRTELLRCGAGEVLDRRLGTGVCG